MTEPMTRNQTLAAGIEQRIADGGMRRREAVHARCFGW
jgi:hypothetical protein